MRWLWIILLIPWVALAQDQSLGPDGEDGSTDVYSDVSAAACSSSTACSATTCETDVDEGADAGGDDLDVCTETNGGTIRFTFPTPSANPSTAAGAQTIDLIMSCTDADTDNAEDCTGSPSFSVEIYCNGAALTTPQTPYSGQAISTVDSDFSTTFTFDTTDCAADGSDLEFHFTLSRSGGSPGNRRWAAIEAVEWEVTHAVGGATPVAIMVD